MANDAGYYKWRSALPWWENMRSAAQTQYESRPSRIPWDDRYFAGAEEAQKMARRAWNYDIYGKQMKLPGYAGQGHEDRYALMKIQQQRDAIMRQRRGWV